MMIPLLHPIFPYCLRLFVVSLSILPLLHYNTAFAQEDSVTKRDPRKVSVQEEQLFDSLVNQSWMYAGGMWGLRPTFKNSEPVYESIALFLTQFNGRIGYGFRAGLLSNAGYVTTQKPMEVLLAQFGPSITWNVKSRIDTLISTVFLLRATPAISYLREGSITFDNNDVTAESSSSSTDVSLIIDFETMLFITRNIAWGSNIFGSITSNRRIDFGVNFMISYGIFPWVKE